MGGRRLLRFNCWDDSVLEIDARKLNGNPERREGAGHSLRASSFEQSRSNQRPP
jgi:hypothetical protein